MKNLFPKAFIRLTTVKFSSLKFVLYSFNEEFSNEEFAVTALKSSFILSIKVEFSKTSPSIEKNIFSNSFKSVFLLERQI